MDDHQRQPGAAPRVGEGPRRWPVSGALAQRDWHERDGTRHDSDRRAAREIVRALLADGGAWKRLDGANR